MARGRHRKPTQTTRNLQRAALITVGAGVPLGFASAALADDVVVQPGDTVSEIAMDRFGLDDWHAFYQQNQAVIGSNPDLILPGQTLHYPGGLLLPKAPVVVTEPAPAQEQTAPAPEAAPQTQVAGNAIISNSYGPVKADTQAAADQVVGNVLGAQLITIGGTRASAIDPQGHPSGRALDWMVLSDRALGDAIVQYHIDHWAELKVEYLIYRQRILYSPNGAWEAMEDRGSPTQNHMDHVHVNYK